MGDSSLFSVEIKLLISFITFLFIFLLLKMILSKRVGMIWQIALSLCLTGCLYFGAYLYIDHMFIGDHYSKQDFNEAIWNRENSERVSMVDDLVDSKILLNKNPNEILDLLGKPTHFRNDTISYIEYDLGNADIGINVHRVLLYIEVDNDVVTKVEKKSFSMD